EALELGQQRRRFLRLRGRQPGRFRGDVGERLVRGRGEVLHDARRIGIGEVERRHPDVEPGTQRNRSLEEGVEPLGLRAPAFTADDGWREALVVVVEHVADGPAAALDDVAIAASVPEDELFAARYGLAVRVLRGEVA